MSYCLAFWVGSRVASHDEASAEFKRLRDEHKSHEPPAPELLAFVSVATERYPDFDDVDESVWSEPLSQCMHGPLLYVPYSTRLGGEEFSRFLGDLAMKMDLVAFDPQKDELFGPGIPPRGEGRGPEVVALAGIERDPQFLYFVRGTDVHRVPMRRAGQGPVGGAEIIYRGNFTVEPGYIYFSDGNGNIARARRLPEPA